MESGSFSSGNVFLDIGFSTEEAYEMALKSDLAAKISSIMKERNLSQSDVAKLANWTQPRVSAMLNSRLSRISVERLFRVLAALNHNVRIIIDAQPSEHSQTTVELAGVA